MTGTMTHEAFVHAVRGIVCTRLPDAERARLLDAKLVYGRGERGLRGVTCFSAWKNGREHDFIEVCAAGEESTVQLAGTTIHELAHCLAGPGAGHGKEWKGACERLGLRRAMAAGHVYLAAGFVVDVRLAIAALPAPIDGAPAFNGAMRGPTLLTLAGPRPCSLGIGTRGGKSRGPGSGSRQRLWVCACPVRVRVASDDFQATCTRCGTAFTRGVVPA